jgi:hypothetical protein
MRTLFTARVAGVLYLVILVFGIYDTAVRSVLTEAGDPVATAENLRNAELHFRLAFAGKLVYLTGEVALTVILYLLLRPVNAAVSLLAAAFRLVSVTMFATNLVTMFAALLILDGDGYPQALALFFLDLHTYGYSLGLVFFAVNCVAMGYLLTRSSHAPTVLGVLLGVTGVCYLVNSFVWFLLPGYGGGWQPVLLAPAFVAETWFCVFLLRTGGGVDRWTEPARPTAT